MRYLVTYIKHGAALSTWCKDLEQAQGLAERLRRGGYIVTVWEHTKEWGRKLDL